MTNYKRVLPRDLFNEANLLKCIGKLTLLIEDGMIPWMIYHYDGEQFGVYQNEGSGALFVGNISFFSVGEGGGSLTFERPLNSRDEWPLLLETEDDAFLVFDDKGEFILKQSDLG